MTDPPGDGARPVAGRLREGLARGAVAEARFSRSLGEPVLFAVVLSAVGSSIYFVLGIVAGEALGLTPLAFLLAALLFVLTLATYVEGTSLHPERGGASTFARYAFNELVSFIAGWAIVLDYLIVMAIAALAVPHYLTAFWKPAGDVGVELVITAAVLAGVVALNVRGISPERLRTVLRMTLLNIVVVAVIIALGLATVSDLGLITDSIDVGRSPRLEDLIFATTLAAAAATGIEAASGLAGELRVGRRGLRRFVALAGVAVFLMFGGVSVVALMAVPVTGGATALGERFVEMPVLGVVSTFEPAWAADGLRYVVGATAAVVLAQVANSQMLGVGRLAYSLATNRQVPSVVGRLERRRSTPYVAIGACAVLALVLALPADVDFLAGLFAFGAMLAFTIAHLSVIVLRFREPARPSAFRVPLSIRMRGGSIPIPAVLGALLSGAGWVSVVVLHEGARIAGGVWMAAGIAFYAFYRTQQDKSLTKRYTIPAEVLLEREEAEYGSILVPVFGRELDDDIVGTAGRLAADEGDEGGGGAMLQALYVFEMPMSLPMDARVPPERVAEAKRLLARAKEVGEEYEGVEVATAMVRDRTAGAAIVSEAKRRGVEAIVLAAEEPSRTRGGALLGGRSRSGDRSVGETTRYVVEKAPCKVILTAPPATADSVSQASAPG
ncbi:MAG: universal stress protein [Actinomycetota bacterium]|nr:universal stress protein [Actinomycetota bacterium]